ncbi:MAG: hypothetical protein ACOZQL_16980 [Myxococcota bacterium]
MRLVAAIAVLLINVAHAEEDAGVPPQPAEAPAPVAVTPPPAAAPSPSVLDQVLAAFRPYGTIKPTVIASSGAVESFSQPNASAITAAGNPVISNIPGEARLSFQVAQTRFGAWFNEKGQVRGHVEIDFIDFAKATPTVQSLIRLRIATIEWAPTDHFTLIAGQDWDLHAPVNPHGGNMVGGRFLSGNSGFMRQQIKAIGRVGVFEIAGAVGMEGVNSTAKDGAFELSIVPTFAGRVAWVVGKGRVGVSGLGTSLRLAPGTAAERRTFAGGVTGYADVTIDRTTLRGEISVGRNMSNIGLLTLGFGTATKDVDEWGGFFSVRHGFTDMHFIYATGGLMRVFDRSSVSPSYSYAALPADGSAPAFSSAALAGTGPGLLHNAGVNLGYELRLTKNLAFMLEGFYLWSEHKLQVVDVERVSGIRQAFGGELAAFVTSDHHAGARSTKARSSGQ